MSVTQFIVTGFPGGKAGEPYGVVRRFPAKDGNPGREYVSLMVNCLHGAEKRTYIAELPMSELPRIRALRNKSKVTVMGQYRASVDKKGETWHNLSFASFLGELIDIKDIKPESVAADTASNTSEAEDDSVDDTEF